MAASIQPAVIRRTAVTRDTQPTFSTAGHTARNPRNSELGGPSSVFPSVATTVTSGGGVSAQQRIRIYEPSSQEVQPGDKLVFGVAIGKTDLTNTSTTVGSPNGGSIGGNLYTWIEQSLDGSTFTEITGTRRSWAQSQGIGAATINFFPSNTSNPASIQDMFIFEFIVPKLNPNAGQSPRFRMRAEARDNTNANAVVGGTTIWTVAKTAILVPLKYGQNRTAAYSPTLAAGLPDGDAAKQNVWTSTFPYYARATASATEGAMYKHFKAAARYTGSGTYGHEVDSPPANPEYGYIERGITKGGTFEDSTSTTANPFWTRTGSSAVFDNGSLLGSTWSARLNASTTVTAQFNQIAASGPKLKLRPDRWYMVRFSDRQTSGATGSGNVTVGWFDLDTGVFVGGTASVVQSTVDATSDADAVPLLTPVPIPPNMVLAFERVASVGAVGDFIFDNVEVHNAGTNLVIATAVQAGDASQETQLSLRPPTGGGTDYYTATATNAAFDGDVLVRREQTDVGHRLVGGSGSNGFLATATGYRFHANDTAASAVTLNANVDQLIESFETRSYNEDNTANATQATDRTQANGGTQAAEGGYAFNRGAPIQAKAKPFNDKQRDGTTDATMGSPGAGTFSSTKGALAASFSGAWNGTERKWIGQGTFVSTTAAALAEELRFSGATVNGRTVESTGLGISSDDALVDVVVDWYVQQDGATQTPATFPPNGDVRTQVSGVGGNVERFNRGEVVQADTYLYNTRGQLLKSQTGLLVEALDVTGGTTVAFAGTTTDANGQINTTYTIGATDPAPWSPTLENTIGTNDVDSRHKRLRVSKNTNTIDSNIEWGVSRKWEIHDAASGTPSGRVFTGKAASPGSDTVTSRNRGQTLFFNGWIYNSRNELLVNPTINFNVRPTGAETWDEANASLALASGQFTGASASYTVDTDEATGGKTLVIASAATGSTDQPRTGTAGTGNFAETSRSSAEWTVSSVYTAEVKTQKLSTRNADPTVITFTIGEDVVYAFARLLDSTGDPISGARVDFAQFDPSGVKRQEDDNADVGWPTDADGWTVGVGFDTRAPAGANWAMRGDSGFSISGNTLRYAANNGNTFTDDQPISMLSAFTSNKCPVVGFGPVTGVPNTLGHPTANEGMHFKPGDRLLIGFGFLVDGVRVPPDPSPAPAFCLARFNQATSKAEILQADFTWKDQNAAGYSTYFFPFKVPIEPLFGPNALEWVASFGTAAQGVTSVNGYVTDTGLWDSKGVFLVVRLHFQTQPFYFSINADSVSPSPVHPYGNASLPEAKVLFGDTGHQHTGGTDGRAIGER